MIWNDRRSSRCRPSPTSSPSGRNAGSGSTTTSRSTSTTTRCRTSCCARRSGRVSRRARSKSSTAASLPRMCVRRQTASIRRFASTCRLAIGAMPTGRRSASRGRPARSAATPQHSSRLSCGSARTLSKASAPARGDDRPLQPFPAQLRGLCLPHRVSHAGRIVGAGTVTIGRRCHRRLPEARSPAFSGSAAVLAAPCATASVDACGGLGTGEPLPAQGRCVGPACGLAHMAPRLCSASCLPAFL